ncbi:MAG TPA: phosphonoacetaldehyde reductase [Ignavibacteria bacterium]|nr:phosphonoacetaldehyde reductase [Ignavibacteria bacterium]HQY51142.1 phosphonoacetaldehyde reductase [Ignavibacteria bacterium]HRA98994.1 phosphonoacetaldehyde reductase [Ignavibacteria bacterium]
MTQKVIIENGSIKKLTDLIDIQIVKRIFLVTGKNSYSISGAERKLKILDRNFETVHFDEVGEIPEIENVKKGIELFNESDSDIVIAVGGGNVIDIAKSINILSTHSETAEDLIMGKKNISIKGKDLIAIPTTAGSGSESTHFAVVYSGIDKYSMADEFILPDIAIVDPELTYSLDSRQTAISGIDAFCQAVESFWSVNSTKESREYSKESIILILKNLKKCVKDPHESARFNMCMASNLAGRAINISKTTAPHAVSYTLTSEYGIPHGQAVCVTLPGFLEFNYNLNDENISEGINKEEHKVLMDELSKILGFKSNSDAKKFLIEFIDSLGLKINLTDLGIKSSEDINIISKNVNTERLKNNPRKISESDLEKILSDIL